LFWVWIPPKFDPPHFFLSRKLSVIFFSPQNKWIHFFKFSLIQTKDMSTRGQKRNKSRPQSSGAGTYTTAKAVANAAKNAARVAAVNAAVGSSPMFVDSEDNKQRSKTSESKAVLSPGVVMSPNSSSQPSVPTPPSESKNSKFNLDLQPLPATGRSSESKLRTVRTGVAAQDAVTHAIQHINEKVLAARMKAEQAQRWAEAEQRAMRVVEEERAAREAEAKAIAKAEREAKEKAAREKAEREAKEKEAKEKAEREVKEKFEREVKEKAEREAKEIADKWIQMPMSTAKVDQFIVNHFGVWYRNGGYGISSNSDSVSEQRYNETRPTFGEIYSDGVEKIFDKQHMRAGDSDCDTVADMGMGCGKVLMQAALQFPNVKRMTGVELMDGRVDACLKGFKSIVAAHPAQFSLTESKNTFTLSILDTPKSVPRTIEVRRGDLFEAKDAHTTAQVLLFEVALGGQGLKRTMEMLRKMRVGSRILTYEPFSYFAKDAGNSTMVLRDEETGQKESRWKWISNASEIHTSWSTAMNFSILEKQS
jgi:hypothetical protein